MANTLLTIDMVTREAVELWHNDNAFLMNINRQYDSSFAKTGAQIGTQLRIRLPNDYTVTNGPALSVQSTANQYTNLVLSTQRHIDVGFGSLDMTLKMQDMSQNILKPMINNLAGNVARTIMSGYTEDQGQYSGTFFPGIANSVSNFVSNVDGSSVIINPTSQQYLDAQAILTENSVPMGSIRKVVNSPRTNAAVVNSLSGLFNPQNSISKQYQTGQMYRAFDFEWMTDPTVTTHTSGSFTAGTVSVADQSGLTILTNAITGQLKAGDIITFPNVLEVNRITKGSAGVLKQFVITATTATTGATSIQIYPALIPPAASGANVQYQTVNSSPAASAAITMVTPASTLYRKNIAFCRDAITLGTADLFMPPNVVGSRKNKDGVALRLIANYYIPGTDEVVSRLDTLFGWLTVRPEWAVIIADKSS